jgi:hypothetical protein
MAFREVLNKLTETIGRRRLLSKNKAMAAAYAAIPYNERVIFVPHCMRKVGACRAKEVGSYYLCAECNACKIGPISKKARELGYKAALILKGGKSMDRLIAELKPRAILGVACFFEGALGMKQGRKSGVTVQFVPLTKDGCADTDVELDEVIKVIERK